MNKVPTFISIYDNALSKDECYEIVNEFETSKDKQKHGVTGPTYEPDPDNKISTEITYFLDDDSLISNILVKKLRIYVEKYKEEYPDIDTALDAWTAALGYNIQKYRPSEGYFSQHCETHDMLTAPRVLVWMFYLNSLDDGGTDFPRYNITTDAVEGRLVLWPSYWTHVHKGHISHTQTKYIATGWFAFQNPDYPAVFGTGYDV